MLPPALSFFLLLSLPHAREYAVLNHAFPYLKFLPGGGWPYQPLLQYQMDGT